MSVRWRRSSGCRDWKSVCPDSFPEDSSREWHWPRIMAYEPEMILLDEPFSALDMYLKDQLQRELAEMLADYKGTVILVSHNRDEVYRFSEELLIIDQGKIEVSGETKEIFHDPVSREAARLTGCKNFSKARRIDAHTAEAQDWGVTLITRREIPEYTKYIGYRAHDFIPVWDTERTAENETAENETVENETAENETVENETAENGIAENGTAGRLWKSVRYAPVRSGEQRGTAL